MRRRLLALTCVLSLCVAGLLAGCGGTGPTRGATGQLRVKVKWPAAKSGKLIPASTKCLKVVVYQEQSSPPLGDKAIGWVLYDTILIPRQAGTTTIHTVSVPPGRYYLGVSAHATEDASDFAQALGTTDPLVVTLNGTTECPITLTGTVTTITLSPAYLTIYGLMGIGKIDVVAEDAEGNVVLLSPEAASWDCGSELSIGPDGTATAMVNYSPGVLVRYTDTEHNVTSNYITVNIMPGGGPY